MDGKRGTPTDHTDLLLNLCKELTKENFTSLKELVKAKDFGNFKPGELERITSIGELFQKMEHKHIIKVGDYGKLKELMRKIDRENIVNVIEETERTLRGLDYAESASGAVSRPNVPLSSNNNNQRMPSQSSMDDAMPMDIQELQDVPGNGQPPDDRPRYEDGKGFVLFINNFVMHAHDRTYLRLGSGNDATNIENLFEEYLPDNRYKLVMREDLTKPKLQTVLEEAKKKLITGRYTRFILIICTHGEQIVAEKDNKKFTEECIFMVDGETITEEELTAPFMGDQLEQFKGKPKVFIIQACRSPRKSDISDDMTQKGSKYSAGVPEQGPPAVSRPVNADALITYATTKGTKAWRNEEQGSWFIDHFCKIVRQHYKKEHLMDLLVRVNDEVSKMVATEDASKQMPCQVSTLTKHIWI